MYGVCLLLTAKTRPIYIRVSKINLFKKISEKYKVIDSTVPTFITIIIVDWVDVFVLLFCNVNIEPFL